MRPMTGPVHFYRLIVFSEITRIYTMGQFSLVCSSCGAVQTKPYSPFCEKCNQMTEVEFDLDKAALPASSNPYIRFYDLISGEGYKPVT